MIDISVIHADHYVDIILNYPIPYVKKIFWRNVNVYQLLYHTSELMI